MKKPKKTFKKRARRKNHHHIKPKSRGGDNSVSNLIWLDINRHAAFHLLFKTMTFEEAGRLLLRASKIKKRHSGESYDCL